MENAVKINKKQRYQKFVVETVYLGEFIDLKKLQENIKQYQYLNRDHPLVLRLLKDTYAVVTKFGAVTFWNVAPRLKAQFTEEIKPFVKSKYDNYAFTESTKVYAGGEADKVTAEKVYIAVAGVHHLKIISYVLSQSVALDRYEGSIEDMLSEIGGIVDNLKTSGRAMMSQRELLKQIGKVLAVKQTAVAHLSLFDKPEDVWESPDLEQLYLRLNSEYDLKVRFDILDEKIEYLSDVSQMLMNFLAEKRSEFLELIVIILIAVEIVLFLPYEMIFGWFR